MEPAKSARLPTDSALAELQADEISQQWNHPADQALCVGTATVIVPTAPGADPTADETAPVLTEQRLHLVASEQHAAQGRKAFARSQRANDFVDAGRRRSIGLRSGLQQRGVWRRRGGDAGGRLAAFGAPLHGRWV